MVISLLVQKTAYLLIPLIRYVAHQHFSIRGLIRAAFKPTSDSFAFSNDALKKKSLLKDVTHQQHLALTGKSKHIYAVSVSL